VYSGTEIPDLRASGIYATGFAVPDYAATGSLRKGSHAVVRKGTSPTDKGTPDDVPTDAAHVIIAIEPVDCDANSFPAGAQIVRIPFRALTKPFLVETKAVLVLGPLVSPQLDAMQIAERLGELGFKGTLRLMGPTLPNPALVSREIRSASGSKDITVELTAVP
jgi:hypothetical protein